jgi:RimJ/RimL family protein N-acetyltransferase
MLTFRQSTQADGPAVWGLIEDYAPTFLTDYNAIDASIAKKLIDSGNLFCIDAFDYPVGVAWYNDQFHDLHLSLHLIIRPAFLRQFLKEDLATLVLDFGFKNFQVGKLKAFTLKPQKMAQKLLLRYGFKRRAYFPRETRVDGKYVDVQVYELSRHDWRYFKNHPEKRMGFKEPATPVET